MNYRNIAMIVIMLVFPGVSFLWGEAYYDVSIRQENGTYEIDPGASFKIFTKDMEHVVQFSDTSNDDIAKKDFFAGFYTDKKDSYRWNGSDWVLDNVNKTAENLYKESLRKEQSDIFTLDSDISILDEDISDFTYYMVSETSLGINQVLTPKVQYPYVFSLEKGIFVLKINDGIHSRIYTFRDKRSINELFPDQTIDEIWTTVETYLREEQRIIPLSKVDRKTSVVVNDLFETLEEWRYNTNSLLSIYPSSEDLSGHKGKAILRKYLALAYDANTNLEFNRLNSYEPYSIRAERGNENLSINIAMLKMAQNYLCNNVTYNSGYKTYYHGMIPLQGVSNAGFIFSILNNIGYPKMLYWPDHHTDKPNWLTRLQNISFGMSYQILAEDNVDKNFFNSCSLIVPDLDKAELGDIVLTVLDQGINCGIISQKGYSLESIKVIFLSRNPTPSAVSPGVVETDLKTFLQTDSNHFEIRRLLAAGDIETKINPIWDVQNPELCKYEIEIGKIYEESQVSNERWPWIPNTGEYLILSDIHLKLYNKAGVLLKGNNYKVQVSSIEDRNFTIDGPIIENNRAQAFKLRIGFGSEKVIHKSEQPGKEYFLADSPEMYISSRNGRLLINDAENAVMAAQICIRPIDAEHAFPGDDLIVKFEVYTIDQDGNKQIIQPSDKENCKVSEVLSVYDKKMVWRANLYMKDTVENFEDSTFVHDWNDMHPWNAPASEKSDTTNAPAWWNAVDWGYNEWNRTYTVGISGDLVFGAGDGTQVINLEDSVWTPVRGQADPYHGYNYYQNAVAYDYDYSDEGFANAWDSPFDFAWKLNEQRLAIWNKFTPSYVNEEQAKWFLQDVKFPNGIDENAIPFEVNSKNNTVIKVTNRDLYRWNRTTAPKNVWKYYWKDVSGGHQPYIPGLGLYWHDIHRNYDTSSTYEQSNFLQEKLIDNDSPLISFTAKKSAGTDCIGFVERTASYRNTSDVRNKNRIYTWQQFPEDRAEIAEDSNFDNDAIKRSEPKEGGGYTTKYGEYPDSKSEVIVSQVIIQNMDEKNLGLDFYSADVTQCDDPSYKGPSDDEFDSLISKFLIIVPGDVIYYGHSHIGEIANVDYDIVRNATTINQLLQSITVIECVYNGSVNFVIKRSMFATGSESNPLTVTTNKRGSWQFQNIPTQGSISVDNLRNWEIRRLKSN